MDNIMKKMISAMLVLVVMSLPALVLAEDVGVAWMGKSGMTNSVVKGMEAYLAEFAPDIKLEYQKELATPEEFQAAIKKFESEKKAMVLLRSTAAKYLAKNPPAIPAFIGGCNDPIQLGVVKDYKKPINNITGVTYALEVASQFDTFVHVVPNMKSLLILLEKGHPGTVIDQKQTQAVCKKKKIKYIEAICKDKKELLAAVEKHKGEVSAIIIGNQGLVIDATADLVKAAPKVPFIAYSSKPVKAGGALCCFAADDVKLGKILGESIAEVVLKGKKVADVPIKIDPKPQLFINAKTAETLGLDIPFVILNAAKIVGVDKKEKKGEKKK